MNDRPEQLKSEELRPEKGLSTTTRRIPEDVNNHRRKDKLHLILNKTNSNIDSNLKTPVT
jgi:hypothetical protein